MSPSQFYFKSCTFFRRISSLKLLWLAVFTQRIADLNFNQIRSIGSSQRPLLRESFWCWKNVSPSLNQVAPDSIYTDWYLKALPVSVEDMLDIGAIFLTHSWELCDTCTTTGSYATHVQPLGAMRHMYNHWELCQLKTCNKKKNV